MSCVSDIFDFAVVHDDDKIGRSPSLASSLLLTSTSSLNYCFNGIGNIDSAFFREERRGE